VFPIESDFDRFHTIAKDLRMTGVPSSAPRRRGRPKLTAGDKNPSAAEIAELLAVARSLVEDERRNRRRKARKAERDYLLTVLALNAGLRASEIAALRVEDLRLDDNPPRVLVVGGKGRKAGAAGRKTADVDEVALGYDVVAQLRPWVVGRFPSDPVFPSERTNPKTGGKCPLTRRGVWGAIKALVRRARVNENYGTHALRHRFIAAEIEAQERLGVVNPYLIARRARHRSVASTMPYVHTHAKKLKEHMAVRKSEL
jgi:integrase